MTMISKQDTFDTPATITLAETLLTHYFNTGIHLSADQRFDSPHLVLRCLLENPPAHLPESVILKQLSVSDSRNDQQPTLFLNEWASMQFLSELTSDKLLAPLLYTGDHDARLMILQDLGDYPIVQGILMGDDSPRAESALTRYGAYLGELHRATIGYEARFREIQAELGAESPKCDSTVDLRNYLEKLQDGLAFINITPTAEFIAEIEMIEATLHSSDNPFRVFIHGDSGAHNVMDMGENILLLDFAFGDYRHGLLDVVSARLGFPHAFRGMASPESVVNALESAYRHAIAPSMPQVQDDAIFNRELAYAVAHWMLGRLSGMLSYIKDREEQGESADEQRGHMAESVAQLLGQQNTLIIDWFKRGVLTYLDSFINLPSVQENLPEIYAITCAVRSDLWSRWHDVEPLPVYPAFRNL